MLLICVRDLCVVHSEDQKNYLNSKSRLFWLILINLKGVQTWFKLELGLGSGVRVSVRGSLRHKVN